MTGDQVVAELARIKPPPASLAVYVDGVAEPKRVPIPNVRKRWARVAAVIDQLPWSAIEAHDKQGGLVGGPWKSDDEGAPPPGAAGLTIREREIADVVLLSFKQAHTMFLGMFGALLSSVKTQMDAMSATSRHMTASYERLMVVQRQALELQAAPPPAAPPDDDDDGMAHLLGIVETLARREQAQAAPPPAPTPKNGNPRKKPPEA